MKIVDILKTFLELFVRFTPKFQWCVLRGYPDYEDNNIAIYEKLIARDFHKVIWVVSSLKSAKPFTVCPETKFVLRGSFFDFYYSSLAKYIFITHGHFIKNIPSNQICTNLWHGLPYKAIGKLDGKDGRTDTYLIATSTMIQQVFADIFGMNEEKIIITGQARTDRLFVKNADVIKDRLFLEINSKTKIFLWLPTFRTTNIGESRVDGKETNNVFNCKDFPTEKFDKYLRDNNAICIVKPHPMAPVKNHCQSKNLIYIDENWLHSRMITLYQLAGIADCLVSDISSIVIDFIMLNKPIVLLFEDLKEYQTSRGFVFNPIEEWLPARVNSDYASFAEDISAVMSGRDPYQEKRAALKIKFFSYNDNCAADRIIDHVFK